LQEQRAIVDAAIEPGLTFSVIETAKIMRRNPDWVRDMLANGQLKFIRLGQRRVVPRAVIIKALTEGT
jgi:hypothetical protein